MLIPLDCPIEVDTDGSKAVCVSEHAVISLTVILSA